MEVKFQKLFKDNSWDTFKIISSLMAPILDLNNQQLTINVQNLRIEKDKLFQQYLKQLSEYLHQVKQKQDKEEEIICIQVQQSLEFHKCIAQHGYNYSVIYLIDIGFDSKTQSKQVQLHNLFQQSIQDYQNKDKNNIRYHRTLLANAYHNLQKGKYDNAEILLGELTKFYNLKEFKSFGSLEERNVQIGFIESVITYKALSYLYSNKLNELEQQIKNLKKLSLIIEDQVDQVIKKRIQNHIELFQIHFYFIHQDLKNSQRHLETLGQNLEKTLLLLFLNQDNNLLSHIETIYYHLFGNELFQVFKELQQFEIINRRIGKSIDIEKIKNLFEKFKNQNSDKSYCYGKGIILILSVIYAILLRLGRQDYDEAIKHINLIFQICKQTYTDFTPFLELFFKYNRLICYLYKIQSKPYDFQQEYIFLGQLNSTNLNKVYIFQKGDEKYIFKKQIKKDDENLQIREQKKFQQLNEACIQMLLCHPNIQNIENIFAGLDLEIVIVQKLQGDNLRQHLNNKKIDQEKAMSYIQQILNAFCYLHSLNIIHSDFKLENVVTVLGDETKIKIIDFGFSQITIFNKFFIPLGFTESYAPKEKKYTFESDIYSIGKSIAEIFENQNFYQSKQMLQLMNLMIETKVQNRCTINQAYHKFQLEMLIYKIFTQIISKYKDSFQQNYQNMQQIYENFADSVHFLFQQFRKIYHNTYSVQQEIENERVKFNQFQSQYLELNILSIIESIKNLLEKKNECIIECLLDNDIKQFVVKLLSYYEHISNLFDNQCFKNFIQIELLEEYFFISSYEEKQQIEQLICQKLINNNSNKKTNQILEQIEKELATIIYSSEKLTHECEYQKLIYNIQNQLQFLENSYKSSNNQNVNQDIESENNHLSIPIQNDIQQHTQENQISQIQVGNLDIRQSQLLHQFYYQQYSQNSYQITNIQELIDNNQDQQNYGYLQQLQSDLQSKQTFYTQSSQSQNLTQQDRQKYNSILSNQSNQQKFSQLELQFQNLSNNNN
ncbi:hypothetical protein ABPG74_001243 [Tetrahymena malaccensis]